MASKVKVDTIEQQGSSGIVLSHDVKLASGTAIKNAAGTALLGEDGALGSGVTGQGWQYLATATGGSGVAAISFDGFFTSEYEHYKCLFHSMTPTVNNKTMVLRMRQSNADVTSAANIRYVVRQLQTNSVAGGRESDAGDTHAIFGPTDNSSNTDYPSAGEFTFHNPNGATGVKIIHGTSIGYNSNNPPTVHRFCDNYMQFFGNFNACSGFSIMYNTDSSSNILGTFHLYGMKNA